MKITKSYKIILLLTAFLLVVSSMFCALFFSPSSSVASASSDASSYFGGLDGNQVKFDGGYLVATVTESSKVVEETDDGTTTKTEQGFLTVTNKLATNDLEIVMVIPNGLKSVTFIVKSGAYYANGNIVAEKVDGAYIQKVETTVDNEIEFDFTSNTAKVNGKTSKSFSLDGDKLAVKTSVNSENYLVFAVSGNSIVAEDVYDGSTLVKSTKVKNIDGISTADLSFKFELKSEGVSADFKILSIDQKASDTSGNYEQTFETDSTGAITKTNVYPIVALNESFYKLNEDGSYSAVKNLMTKYTLTLTPYTVLGNVSSSSLYIQKDNANMWLSTEDNPKSLMFLNKGTKTVNIVKKNGTAEIVYKTVSVNVVNFNDDDTAPKYVYNEDAYQAYLVALEQAHYNYDKGSHVALGTSMTVPSLKDLVFDDIQTYEELTKTVYYNTNTTEDKTSSGMTISLAEEGDYLYKVVFTDGQGNKMDKDDDFEAGAKYADYVFKFNMVADSPIEITPAPAQGTGCVSVKYTASKFDINADGCSTTYKLYYKAKASDTEWVEIPKASSVTDEEYDENGYDYDDIQSIGYDGSLTFTPNAKGIYKIECSAVSSATSKSAVAEIEIVVDQEPSKVKVYTDWVANNVWSVVFLSIGTLCLIGIVVLLCIKPKDEVE